MKNPKDKFLGVKISSSLSGTRTFSPRWRFINFHPIMQVAQHWMEGEVAWAALRLSPIELTGITSWVEMIPCTPYIVWIIVPTTTKSKVTYFWCGFVLVAVSPLKALYAPVQSAKQTDNNNKKKKLCSYSVDLVKLAETPAEASVPLATCDPLWPRHFSFEPFGFLNTGKISSFALSQTILTETFMQLTSSTAPIWAAPVVSLFVNSMAIPR